MVHLVYCDNVGKAGERVLDKIKSGTKTMVVRGAAGRKIPHSRVFAGETLYFNLRDGLPYPYTPDDAEWYMQHTNYPMKVQKKFLLRTHKNNFLYAQIWMKTERKSLL